MAVILSTEPQAMRPRAAPGVVDIWQVGLGDEALDELDELLCARERARAARLVRERDRVLWRRSRGALRLLLGRYLDRDPRRLRFELGPCGKPRLAGWSDEPRQPGPTAPCRPEPARLSFNLSHSGELMLVAVTAEAEVGVDVERTRARYGAKFLKEWTKREAIVKCLGTGLARARIAMDDSLNTLAIDGPDVPWTAGLDMGREAFATVAVASGPCELRLLNGAYEPS